VDTKNAPSETKSFLTLNVRPFDRVYDTDLHHAPVRDRLKPLSHTINKKEGTLYHTMEVTGTATICIRVQTSASERQTLAFVLRVTSSDEQPEILKAAENEKAKGASHTINVDQHLSHMELELQRISKAMENVLKEADQNRDRDDKFHQQALAMHSATTFWPIVQVCVLLITGFTQTTHIVQFFKSRRII
jgi:emp24/gp25L/p24 family/GOLD